MTNSICDICGGCLFRNLSKEEYQKNKQDDFIRTISLIKNSTPIIEPTIFIEDGCRRRADMEFVFDKKKQILGFNEEKTHNIVNINECPMLTSSLNNLLPKLHSFLEEFCSVTINIKNKKKIETKKIQTGSLQMLEADNGFDFLLKIQEEPSLEHRMIVADFVNSQPEILRMSWQIKNLEPETIIEKVTPEIYISEYSIPLPQNVFLQASKNAETKMIEKVLDYIGDTTGKIADLFCGLGTFTYPLAKNKNNTVLSVDSSSLSTEGLKRAINKNQIHNIEVVNKNLFKYPLDASELKNVNALVIDPPRAGAHEQCIEISKIPSENKPKKIVFISCNPKTFVYDAQILIDSGYSFDKVTLVDQFVYSKHQELIALFTYNH
jgi:23S rRNA (uracil1939-C5)-methyltransferase